MGLPQTDRQIGRTDPVRGVLTRQIPALERRISDPQSIGDTGMREYSLNAPFGIPESLPGGEDLESQILRSNQAQRPRDLIDAGQWNPVIPALEATVPIDP